jgi:hypothetical protein
MPQRDPGRALQHHAGDERAVSSLAVLSVVVVASSSSGDSPHSDNHGRLALPFTAAAVSMAMSWSASSSRANRATPGNNRSPPGPLS